MKRIILTPEQMDHALGLDRPMLNNANKETTMSYYGIDDGNGNQVSTGLTERDAGLTPRSSGRRSALIRKSRF